MNTVGFYFDLDGTLVDSEKDLFAAAQLALGENISLQQPFNEMVALGSRAMLTQLAATPLTEQQLDTAQQDFLQYYAKHLDIHTVFYTGLDKLLLELQAQLIPHAIVTNKSYELSDKLMQRILPQWDGVIIGDNMAENYLSKPAPDRILKAIELTQAEQIQCFYFGDYPSDIEAAKRAGCHAVALRFGFHNPHNPPENWGADTILDSPEELVHFIQQKM